MVAVYISPDGQWLIQHLSSVSAESTDMKFFLVALSLIGYTLAEAPYTASGSKPEGAFLLLPPEYKQAYSASSSQLNKDEDLSNVNEKVMDRLRQEAGSDSGSYHVYLADGRLQKVQYTSAPVLSGQQGTSQNSGVQDYSGSQQKYQQYSNQYKQPSDQKSGELNPVIAQFGKLQQELQQQQIQQLQQRQQQLELEQQKLQNQQEQLRSATYVASLQFSNVEPITSPVYSYKPSPVTRILRYAPQY